MTLRSYSISGVLPLPLSSRCRITHRGWTQKIFFGEVLNDRVVHQKLLVSHLVKHVTNGNWKVAPVWMCSTGPSEFKWLQGYICKPSFYRYHIGSIQLPYSCHIFQWLCVWGCSMMFCHLSHMYPGNNATLFPLVMFSLRCVQTIGYIMPCGSCSFLAHYAILLSSDLSEGIGLLKCLSCICHRVCV